MTVTHLDGGGNTISTDKHSFYAPPLADVAIGTEGYPDWQEGHEFLTQYFDASGQTLLRSETMNWAQRDPSTNQTIVPSSYQTKPQDARVTEHDTTLETGQTSRISYTYSIDASNNITDEYDYDWDNTTLLRHTNTAYNTAYTNILDLPTETKVYDGGGSLLADTQFTYDGSTLQPEASVTGYDSSVSSARGNLTSLRQCVNTANGCDWNSNTSTIATTLIYDIVGNVRFATDPRTYTTQYLYNDPQNTYAHLTSIIDPLNQTKAWTYDYSTGHPTQSTDPNLVNDVYQYADPVTGTSDALDRVKVISRADSTSSGNLTNVTYTSPTEVNLYADQNALNDKVLRTQNLYDGFGRPLESRIYTGYNTYRSTPQTYDSLGRIQTVTNEFGAVTQYWYDALGRTQLVETLTDSAPVQTQYSGNTVTVIDQNNRTRASTYDALGRLTKVVEDPSTAATNSNPNGYSGLNFTTTYSYDALGDLKTVNQSGQTRTFTYDSLKRLTSSTNPETGTISYSSYDGNGNLLTRTDNRQVTTNYSYDQLNRVLSKTYSSGTPGVTYTYCNPPGCGLANGLGHLQSVTTSIGNSTQYTGFSPAGQVTSHQQVIGSSTYPFTYGYALVGNLVGEQYPSTRSLTLGYGYANEPLFVGGSLTDTQGNQTSTTYVAWVNFAGFKETYRSLGSLGALVLNRGYNNREQLSSLTLHNWNNSDNSPNYLQFMMNYYYGGSTNNGNLLLSTVQNSPSTLATPSQSLSPQLSQSYTYDNVNRLIGVSDTAYSRSMCYDAFGNGWVTAYSGSTPVPGNAPEILNGACPSASTSTPYSATTNQQNGVNYDAAGNETSYGGNTLTYDAENRLSAIISPSGSVLASYQYDGDGRRISKTVSGVTTNYVYDVEGRLMAEYEGGSLSKEYIRMHSQFISSQTELVAIENAPGNGSPCTTCFVISDDLGNVRLTANNDGSAVARHDYTPFGEELFADQSRPASAGFGGADGATERFTGKERDAESGLDYFGARYYGSALGRFTSTDPNQASASLFEPQSWNQYSYVWNRPFSYTDPNGKNPLLVTAAIGAGVGALVGGGFELASQLGKNGYSLDDVKWGKVGTAALGGGVAGGITGLTLGLGSAAGITLGTGATVAVNAGANIIGGEVQRQANDVLGIESAPTGADEVAAVAFDGVWGGVGGLTGGRIADELFPLPNVRKEIQLLQFANRRSTRPAQIQSFRSAANQQFNLNAATSGVQGGLRTSVYTWWSQLFWNASSQSKKEPKACTEAHDSSGQGTGTVCH